MFFEPGVSFIVPSRGSSYRRRSLLREFPRAGGYSSRFLQQGRGSDARPGVARSQRPAASTRQAWKARWPSGRM